MTDDPLNLHSLCIAYPRRGSKFQKCNCSDLKGMTFVIHEDRYTADINRLDEIEART